MAKEDYEKDQAVTEFNMGAHFMASLRRFLDESNIAGIRGDIFLKYRILLTVKEEIGAFMENDERERIKKIKESIDESATEWENLESEERKDIIEVLSHKLYLLGEQLRIVMLRSGILVPKTEMDPKKALSQRG